MRMKEKNDDTMSCPKDIVLDCVKEFVSAGWKDDIIHEIVRREWPSMPAAKVSSLRDRVKTGDGKLSSREQDDVISWLEVPNFIEGKYLARKKGMLEESVYVVGRLIRNSGFRKYSVEKRSLRLMNAVALIRQKLLQFPPLDCLGDEEYLPVYKAIEALVAEDIVAVEAEKPRLAYITKYLENEGKDKTIKQRLTHLCTSKYLCDGKHWSKKQIDRYYSQLIRDSSGGYIDGEKDAKYTFAKVMADLFPTDS